MSFIYSTYCTTFNSELGICMTYISRKTEYTLLHQQLLCEYYSNLGNLSLPAWGRREGGRKGGRKEGGGGGREGERREGEGMPGRSRREVSERKRDGEKRGGGSEGVTKGKEGEKNRWREREKQREGRKKRTR